jgi:carboxynorspermidine decarboxylase
MNEMLKTVPTPCYVVDKDLLKKNLALLRSVEEKASCKVLLALKGFSMFSLFPLIGEYLSGVTASSPFEARLGFEEMGKETHIYAPAFSDEDFGGILPYADHIVFNSFAQWEHFKPRLSEKKNGKISCGIRINPEYSEIGTPIYNPCYRYSRLGVTEKNFKGKDLSGIDGLHFHTLCEQNADTLARTVQVVEEKFGDAIRSMKWVNFGGGHHITRPDYDVKALIATVLRFREKYSVDVYLEPGEAVALHTGVLVASVLDIVENEKSIAILDASAACHMPDVLEMPYRPQIEGAGAPGRYPFEYRLGGPTCLAGDVIGDYSFPAPLKAGDRVVFMDMAHYTMVKNNTFNGINLPSIACMGKGEGITLIKTFGYEDFKGRLS